MGEAGACYFFMHTGERSLTRTLSLCMLVFGCVLAPVALGFIFL